MNCEALFSSEFLDLPSKIPPQRWKNIPKGEIKLTPHFYDYFLSDLQNLYSRGNQVNITDWFLNTAEVGGGRKVAKVFTEKEVNETSEFCTST